MTAPHLRKFLPYLFALSLPLQYSFSETINPINLSAQLKTMSGHVPYNAKEIKAILESTSEAEQTCILKKLSDKTSHYKDLVFIKKFCAPGSYSLFISKAEGDKISIQDFIMIRSRTLLNQDEFPYFNSLGDKVDKKDIMLRFGIKEITNLETMALEEDLNLSFDDRLEIVDYLYEPFESFYSAYKNSTYIKGLVSVKKLAASLEMLNSNFSQNINSIDEALYELNTDNQRKCLAELFIRDDFKIISGHDSSKKEIAAFCKNNISPEVMNCAVEITAKFHQAKRIADINEKSYSSGSLDTFFQSSLKKCLILQDSDHPMSCIVNKIKSFDPHNFNLDIEDYRKRNEFEKELSKIVKASECPPPATAASAKIPTTITNQANCSEIVFAQLYASKGTNDNTASFHHLVDQQICGKKINDEYAKFIIALINNPILHFEQPEKLSQILENSSLKSLRCGTEALMLTGESASLKETVELCAEGQSIEQIKEVFYQEHRYIPSPLFGRADHDDFLNNNATKMCADGKTCKSQGAFLFASFQDVKETYEHKNKKRCKLEPVYSKKESDFLVRVLCQE